MTPDQMTAPLVKELGDLFFAPPVAYIYNPLEYAAHGYDAYFRRFGTPPKEIVFVGMNPGPWGMAQTGVPFGEVDAVKNWMGIEEKIGKPDREHPKRPVEGFACSRSEVSGRRLWGWARERFRTPDRFFSRFFVVNWCPLMFMEDGGRNRTPDKLPVAERKPLFEICDRYLKEAIDYLRPGLVIGIGVFAGKRAAAALKGSGIPVGRITHPSPANPLANRGWADRIEKELGALGVV